MSTDKQSMECRGEVGQIAILNGMAGAGLSDYIWAPGSLRPLGLWISGGGRTWQQGEQSVPGPKVGGVSRSCCWSKVSKRESRRKEVRELSRAGVMTDAGPSSPLWGPGSILYQMGRPRGTVGRAVTGKDLGFQGPFCLLCWERISEARVETRWPVRSY